MRGPASDREKAWEDYQAGQKQSAAEAERNSDVDGDNIPDRIDNCPLVRTFNHDQRDFDKDGSGDVCDPTPNCSHKLFNCGRWTPPGHSRPTTPQGWSALNPRFRSPEYIYI